ncbi:protein-L-isoaspartate(D-aspartate) O-methyltransferase [Beijerinckia indica]|uniref:Protein-L-isoaspartate O-methyltransferase n=1 Tax=Beijerinckia indica subsp. indica (strain ATCC 9039 / DSM 1715 / NCIMB 8712) TaxID=395963 RepID=B2IJF9_BEII9|nr:protein-L-isoaspartate(D-aspartate) O-methyltransferase [Beijerinckia indica]ACB96272.1 Protein-L-isoaspartate(D-aspartate) O-methyltransferase [Beijerinckia indica subsp. indica ATCC 9039]
MTAAESPRPLSRDALPIAEAETKAAFLLRLRSGGIRDLALLRALEIVPREIFVPQQFADFAGRDLALPLPCGQTMTAPSLLARMIAALDLSPRHRVLEIGTGSGYATAVLSHIVREVVSFERFHTLAEAARMRLAALARDNILAFWGDGLAVPVDIGSFDRIIVHAASRDIPAGLLERLADDGLLLFAREIADEGQSLWRIARGRESSRLEEDYGPCHFQPLLPGVARFL